MQIPWEKLSSDVLRGVILEFVTREGTDYGVEYSLEEKIEFVLAQIKSGKAEIVFNPEDETCNIIVS
jgi:uncharacterized protein